jgi:hypothetical protein
VFRREAFQSFAAPSLPCDPPVLLNAGRVLTGGFMDLTLSDDEVVTLRGLLQDYLPGLKFEVARTELKDFRHILVQRQTLCERLLDELSEVSTRE